MPEIRQTFVVERPVATVWDFFQDVAAVADCMPGVELLEDLGGGSYKGRMKVKLGPITAQFQGDATIKELDEATRTGTISAKGVDRQGGSRASAQVRYLLNDAGDTTTVGIQADITLQGPMAQFGRTGLIEEVSGLLTKEFVDCLGAKLAAGSAAEAAEVRAGDVKGFRLFLQSLWGWFRSRFRPDKR